MAFDSGHALLIGVGSYPKLSSRWQAPITAQDAQALAAELQNSATAGYPAQQVTILSDGTATKADILAALDALAATVGVDATVFFFYSGHGHYGADGAYYLTTHDTEVDLVTVGGRQRERVRAGSGISQAELLAKIGALKARKVVLVFNACHSGELTPTLGLDEEPVLGENLPEEASAALLGSGEGRAIITACRPKQYSFIGNGANTIFAQSLIEGLQGVGVTSRGGLISVYDLYGYLYEAVGDEVRRQVRADDLARLGGTQEPELSIIRQVGAFPVALYRGASTLGAFPDNQTPPTDMAVREISRAAARSLYRQLVQVQIATTTNTTTTSAGGSVFGGNLSVGGNVQGGIGNTTNIGHDQNNITDSSGASVGNQGSINQTFGDSVQGNKTGDVSINQRGGVNFGVGNRIGRMGDIVGGDVVHGDKVGGDKVGGDKITVGNISGRSNVAIGRGANVGPGIGGADLAQIFAQIYRHVDARQETLDVTNDDVRGEVKKIEEEAKKGDQANESRLLRAFSNLAGMAEDIFDVTVAALTSPLAAASTLVKKIAARARAEKASR